MTSNNERVHLKNPCLCFSFISNPFLNNRNPFLNNRNLSMTGFTFPLKQAFFTAVLFQAHLVILQSEPVCAILKQKRF